MIKYNEVLWLEVSWTVQLELVDVYWAWILVWKQGSILKNKWHSSVYDRVVLHPQEYISHLQQSDHVLRSLFILLRLNALRSAKSFLQKSEMLCLFGNPNLLFYGTSPCNVLAKKLTSGSIHDVQLQDLKIQNWGNISMNARKSNHLIVIFRIINHSFTRLPVNFASFSDLRFLVDGNRPRDMLWQEEVPSNIAFPQCLVNSNSKWIDKYPWHPIH